MSERDIGEVGLRDILKLFRYYKSLSEKAIAQVPEDKFFVAENDESNSVAVLVKHMAGNLRSRWRDFLTTDGEKDDRFRDGEFITDSEETRESLMTAWERGWTIAFESIENLGADDLLKTITIRSEPHTVIEALNRALTHAAYHAGQFALLAKQYAGSDWTTLSIAKGKSEEYLAEKRKKFGQSK